METPSDPPMQRSEFTRKLLHMFPGVLPFVLRYSPHTDPLLRHELIFLVVLAVGLTLLFLACWKLVRRDGETDLVYTVASYPLVVLSALVAFPDRVEFACVVVCVLALGDGSAYLFGRRWGRARLPWNAAKSWAGSIAFVAVSGPVATLAYWGEARPDVPLGLAAICGFSAAIAGSVAESLPVSLTDNLRVGVAALLAVVASHFAAVALLYPTVLAV
jgi:farnesol kinase